jgi:Mannosyltransferase (PIG-V)
MTPVESNIARPAMSASGSASLDARVGASPVSVARRHALWAFLISRLPVAFIAIAVGQVAHGAFVPAGALRAPKLAHPFGSGPLSGIADGIFSPLMRWDSVFYVSIAHSGYGVGEPFARAFFPGYPLTIRLFGGLQSSPAALLISSYAVALAAFLGALYILHRLVEVELGTQLAWPALLLFAMFPGAVFFSTPLSESLFLLLTIGSFYAARTGRWPTAGILAALASGTRPVGVMLFVPLAVMYFYGPRADASAVASRLAGGLRERLRPIYPLRANALWLLLVPVGALAYAIYLHYTYGSLANYQSSQAQWQRGFHGPFGAIVMATGHLFRNIGDLPHLNVDQVREFAEYGVLLFVIAATVGTFRKLPVAYGLYVVASLALPLSFPATDDPLLSILRFTAVLFPLFMWFALFCEQRRLTRPVLLTFAVLLFVAAGAAAHGTWIA